MTTRYTYEQAVKAVQATQHLLDKTAAFLDAQGLDPRPNSLAARELQTYANPEALLTAYSQGAALIESAGDHLMALTRILTEPVQTMAPWTMVRAVLEASALACWLLSPQITTHVRVGRSLALRYEGFVQQAKFGQAANRPVETAQVKARIDEVEAVAESLGFARLRNPRGKRTGIGQVMPSATELIREVLNEEADYRLLSAMAHAHNWAQIKLSFRKADETNVQKTKTVLMEKHISNEVVLWLCNGAARYFAQPLKSKCALFGWDLEQLNVILDNVFREMCDPSRI